VTAGGEEPPYRRSVEAPKQSGDITMTEPVRERETTIVTTDGGGGGGGTIIAVVLLIAIIALLFYLFGGQLLGGADSTKDVKVDVNVPAKSS
jgi:hypothetical protein